MNFPILTFLTFIPVAGMFIILFLKKENTQAIKYTALFATGIQVILAAVLMSNYNYSLGGINDVQLISVCRKIHVDFNSGFSLDWNNKDGIFSWS